MATYVPHAAFFKGAGSVYAVGLTRSGWELVWDAKEHQVNDTTSWGKSLIETIYLGADWTLSARCLEYAAPGPGLLLGLGVPELSWPWNANSPQTSFTVGTGLDVRLEGVSQRGTKASGVLTLTAAGGVNQFPAALAAGQALVAKGGFNFDSKNRECQLSARLLPQTGTQAALATGKVAASAAGDGVGGTLPLDSVAGFADAGVGTLTIARVGVTLTFTWDDIDEDTNSLLGVSVINPPGADIIALDGGEAVTGTGAVDATTWFLTS